MAVLRYTGAPESGERLGYVGKGVTCDTGGYCLKPGKSMETHEGGHGRRRGGGGGPVRALAAVGAKVNVTAVIPACENRISRESTLPGDLITSLSGQTIEVLNTDAEGRLILADALTWAIREEGCTPPGGRGHPQPGAICAMLGNVAAGVMASDDGWYDRLLDAAALSGERLLADAGFPGV